VIDADGAEISRPQRFEADVVIVGSGPAGAMVARKLSRAGAKVLVIEEGPFVRPEDHAADGFNAMSRLYRDLGASLLLGRAPMPFVQGRAVGGTSVVNGAISWRLPKDVHDAWTRTDPAIGEALPWSEIEARTDEIERELHIAPTDPKIAGVKNELMARAAEALGIEHRPIARNVKGCEGLGRCLQGCPIAKKQSMDLTYLPDAVAHGAKILSSARVDRVLVERGRAIGVAGVAKGGGSIEARADRAVILAASAIQSPMILEHSGLTHGPLGRHFQCHPGVSVSARFKDPVRMWRGATQGHEVIGLRKEGIKLEVLGFDLSIAAMRMKGAGRDLSRGIADLAHWTSWGAAIRAESQGVLKAKRHRARVSFDLARGDIVKMRRAVRVLSELFFAAGAERVSPGVAGYREELGDPSELARFEEEAPWDPRAYSAAVTHMFGTCRMGSDPRSSVVRTDFRHHTTDRLYVADSSVFPSNTGVNPQTAILALAAICAARVVC
jgi:choline dehydrogenase-like flavoprotein